jgi:L-lactate dehydrogenase
VIGSGTVLDTARFRHAVARRFDLAPESVRAYVIGEHGDSAVLVWSATTLCGVAFERYAAQAGIDDAVGLRSRIGDGVRDAAYEIIEQKGRTNYGVARAVASTAERIIGDDHAVVPVSTLVSGHHGIDDEVYLSLPCTLDRGGVRDVVELDLSTSERAALADSAGVIADSIDRLPSE